MLQIVNKIYHNIQEHKLIKSEKKLLVAFSGGQDSVCLLLIFYLLRNQIEFSFDVIWVNHFWQKSTFFTMLHVSKSSRCFSSRTILWLPLTQVFSEQSARDWRRAALQRTHVFYGYDSSAQGHNKSDRVETIFFNLIRGAGQSGVSALHWIDNPMCFCMNKFYPIFVQLLKQTHVKTTRIVSFHPISTMRNNNSSQNKCIQKLYMSSNRYSCIEETEKTSSSRRTKVEVQGISSPCLKKHPDFLINKTVSRFNICRRERFTNCYYQLKQISFVEIIDQKKQ